MALGATLGRLAALGSPPLNLAAGMLRAGCSWQQLGELQLDTWHRAPALPGSSLLCSIYTGDGVYSPGENAAIFLRRWLLVVSGLTGPDNEGGDRDNIAPDITPPPQSNYTPAGHGVTVCWKL